MTSGTKMEKIWMSSSWSALPHAEEEQGVCGHLNFHYAITASGCMRCIRQQEPSPSSYSAQISFYQYHYLAAVNPLFSPNTPGITSLVLS